MKVIELKENQKEKWNNFVKTNSDSSLLQSWQWGQFQESLGRKIWRLAIEPSGHQAIKSTYGGSAKDERLSFLAVALVIKQNLPFGKSYLYCPRGPIARHIIKESCSYRVVLKQLLRRIKEIAKRENAIFLRVDPATNSESEFFTTLLLYNFAAVRKQVQPKDTLVLDITRSENELLSQMHYKTRYNIRLAKRKGVKVSQSIDLKDIDIFWDLLSETTKREGFKSHSKQYYQKQLEILGRENLIKLFLAKYKGKVIASNIVSFFGDTTTYLHGASLYKYRNLMAPYLLQWEAIVEAKKRGCKFYDFWGVAPPEKPSHPWIGITRFKKGFGGKEIHYIGAWDKVYQIGWYGLYNLAKKII